MNTAPQSRMHEENGTNPADLSMYQSLNSFFFSVKVHTAKTSHFHNKINSYTQTLQNIQLSYLPPSAITHHLFNSWWQQSVFLFIHTVTNHTYRQKSLLLIFSQRQKYLNLSSHPHPPPCPLVPIPSHLLQAISPTHLPALTHNISISTNRNFPTTFKQARVTPLLKNYTKHLPFIAKNINKLFSTRDHLSFHWILADCESSNFSGSNCRFDNVNHQFPLSTLSSLGNTETLLFTGLNPIPHRSFRVAWRGVPSGSFLKDQFLDPFSSPYTLQHWGLPYRHMDSPTIPMLMTHSFIYLFSIRWSKDCCMDPRLPGRHG